MIFMRRAYYFPGFDEHDFHLMLPAWRKRSQAESTDNIVCADVVVNFGSEGHKVRATCGEQLMFVVCYNCTVGR